MAGATVTVTNRGNIFYSGDIDARKAPAAFQTRVFPTRVDGLRADGLDRLDTNIQREFKIKERTTLQLRLDALNVANRSQFDAPNLDPPSTNFAKVTTNPSSTMRFLLILARIKF